MNISLVLLIDNAGCRIFSFTGGWQVILFILQTSVFKGHSFRIGAASAAALHGQLDGQIRVAGKWASDAHRKYIRLSYIIIVQACLGMLCRWSGHRSVTRDQMTTTIEHTIKF